VANLWCAAEPLLKLRHLINSDPSHLWRHRVTAIATITTATMLLPAAILYWRYLWTRNTGDKLSPMRNRVVRESPPPSRDAPALHLAAFAISLSFFLASYQVCDIDMHQLTISYIFGCRCTRKASFYPACPLRAWHLSHQYSQAGLH
jgi:hypothetical protein